MSNRKKLAMRDGWKENEISGTTKGKKKGDVKLPKLPIPIHIPVPVPIPMPIYIHTY